MTPTSTKTLNQVFTLKLNGLHDGDLYFVPKRMGRTNLSTKATPGFASRLIKVLS